jgi:hypothetical protein
MARPSTSDRLKLVDQYIHALVERFYLKPSVDEAVAGLSSSELFALSVLGRKETSSMAGLAAEGAFTLSGMTVVVNRLVAKGCVRRFGMRRIGESSMWNWIRRGRRFTGGFLKGR